jgi:hypothetical protein
MDYTSWRGSPPEPTPRRATNPHPRRINQPETACYNSRRRGLMRADDSRKTVVKMLGRKFLTAACAALFALLLVAPATAQKRSKKQQEPTTGAITGRVKVAPGATPGGVAVTVRRGDEEVARRETNPKGEFQFEGLAPGTYGLTLRKAGLEVGRMEDVQVRAGQTVSLKDRLYLPVDDGAIAHIRGSVFDPNGRSVNGAKVELARVGADGSVKKLDDRVSNSTGSFAFRLPPERAHYRLTAKADGAEPATQELDIDGAAIYRVALSLRPKP